MPDPPPVTPTVLGVDDFARRRGHRYATVLLDMHTRRPIDVLPDRTADTLAAWLRDHPGVQIICRDRGGSYADGARKGAPDAIQVADRWHLLKNLSDTVEKVIRGHRRCLRTHTEPPSALAAPPNEPVAAGRRATNTRQRHAAVHALRAEGLSIKATARRLYMNVRTARKYAHATTAEALIGPNASSRPSVLAPFHSYLRQRLTDGRRHPEHANEIRSDLAGACTNPALGIRDKYESRTGWDYAHEGLRAHVVALAHTTITE